MLFLGEILDCDVQYVHKQTKKKTGVGYYLDHGQTQQWKDQYANATLTNFARMVHSHTKTASSKPSSSSPFPSSSSSSSSSYTLEA